MLGHAPASGRPTVAYLCFALPTPASTVAAVAQVLAAEPTLGREAATRQVLAARPVPSDADAARADALMRSIWAPPSYRPKDITP